MKDIKIYAPPYQQNSGGIKVLYKLNELLNERGINSSILTWGEDLEDKDSIVVYPEVIKGNPLNAKHVVRYVLYYPGVNGGDKVYLNNEHVFTYSNMFLGSIKNVVQGRLYISTIEDIFEDKGKKRDKICCYGGKGGNLADMPINWLEITRDYPAKRERLVEIFQTSICFVCFDPCTVMIQEANLCGCPVVLMSGYEKHKHSEYGLNGICSRFVELDIAARTTGKVRRIHDSLKGDIDLFIDYIKDIK